MAVKSLGLGRWWRRESAGAVLSRSTRSERVRASFSLSEGQQDALSLSSGRVSPSPAAAPGSGRCQSLRWCTCGAEGTALYTHTHTLCTCGTAGTAKHSRFAAGVGQCLCSCGHPRCCSELFNTAGLCCCCCSVCIARHRRQLDALREASELSCYFQISQPVFGVDGRVMCVLLVVLKGGKAFVR